MKLRYTERDTVRLRERGERIKREDEEREESNKDTYNCISV